VRCDSARRRFPNKVPANTQSNSQSFPTDEAGRRTRIERIRQHYLREAERIDAFDRAVTSRERIGLWGSIAWLLFAGYYANPGNGWIWDHPFVIASALLIAVAGERIGASLIAVLVALFVTARGSVLLFDRHFTSGLLAIVLSLIAVYLIYFASDVASQGWMRSRRDAKYAVPDQDMFDRFDEIEARIRTRQPFGIFLRSFYKETSLASEDGVVKGVMAGSKVDYRPLDAIRDLIGSGDTYSILDPIDPVHANPFPTAITDPDNWMGELERLMARASWIVLFYEYETHGLDNVVRMLEEKYADKSIAVFGPQVLATDPVWKLLSSACKWSFRLQSQEAEGLNRSNSGVPPMAMAVDAPPAFNEWLEARKAGGLIGSPNRTH
jgi:hypothetical protein